MFAFLVALYTAAAAAANSNTEIERHASTDNAFAVNSWIVPTESGLLVVDTQFTVSEAAKLAARVVSGGRPLRAIIITHPHPDHYNGTCRLLEIARVPVYATQSTIDGIRKTAEAKRTQWKPSYGKDYPDTTCLPDKVLPASGGVTVDGLDFRVIDYGPGEASTESVLLVPKLHAAFVGDLIYTKVHPWLAEGRSQAWLEQLDRLASDVPSAWKIHPGHGPAGDFSLIGAQRDYIVSFRTAIEKHLTSAGLSGQAPQVIVDEFRTRYPNWSLEMLIPINAAAVAKELAEKKGKVTPAQPGR
jgi:glyoxylase-like metal-dependent hydrolase (beta-lactamase superfamily II)